MDDDYAVRRTFVCRHKEGDDNKARTCGGGWWMEWHKDHPPTCPNGKRKGFHNHVLTELAPTVVVRLTGASGGSGE